MISIDQEFQFKEGVDGKWFSRSNRPNAEAMRQVKLNSGFVCRASGAAKHYVAHASSMRPMVYGGAGACAALVLLDDVHRHRLRRTALHLPPRRSERDAS